MATVSGSAAADEIDAGLTVTGEGEFSVEIDADDVNVSSEGVYTDVSSENGIWSIEGEADGGPIGGDHVFVTIYGYEQLISSESDDDADLELAGDALPKATGPAAEGELDAALSVTGEGEFSAEVAADEVYVSSEGVFTDVTFQNGAWVIEGRANGTPIDGGYSYVTIYGDAELISSESDDDANFSFTTV